MVGAVVTERSTDEFGNAIKKRNEAGEEEYIINSNNLRQEHQQEESQVQTVTIKGMLG